MPLPCKSHFLSVFARTSTISSRTVCSPALSSRKFSKMSFETTGTINSFGGKLLKLAHEVRIVWFYNKWQEADMSFSPKYATVK